ncbi:MAG: NmrA family NAD(P)-binding protein [Burkholderiales bacterium]|nr:NmrA family NAD(P)-binding protein [Burkholderiales bacterium]
MNNKNKIAIFGATGSLGGCVLNAIRSNDKFGNSEVVAIAHQRRSQPDTVQTRLADYADPDSLIQALQGVNTAIYAMPINREMEKWNATLVKAADICEVERLIRFSGPLADARSSFLPLSIQGNMDDRALAREFGQAAILRTNFLMQNFVTSHRYMVRDGSLLLPACEGRISYIDLEDVGSAVLKMLEDFDSYDGQIFDVTGAVAWNNAEIAEIFSDVLRKECSYQALELAAYSGSLKEQGMDAFQTQFMVELLELADMDEFSFIGEGIYTILAQRPKSFYTFVMDNKACWQ